jgi:hypothetical protein
MNRSIDQTEHTAVPDAPLPTCGSDKRKRGPLSRIVRPAVLVLALAILAGGGSWFWFGSFANAMAYLDGYSLIAEAETVSVGSVPSREEVFVTFRLRNLTASRITVVGAVSSCECVAINDLPLTIRGGEVADFTLRFTPGQDSAGTEVEHTALLYLDAKNPPILLKANARVVSSQGT